MRWLDRVRRNPVDALGLYLLPGLAALLPWPLAFALLKRLAHVDCIYREAVDGSWLGAREYLRDRDERTWKWHFRLLRMVDQVDSYLTLLRSERWWSRQITQHGDWPRPAACVCFTYHWGSGNWVWRRLRAHGIQAYFLARRAQARDLGASRLALWYGYFRAWALHRIGCLGPLYTGGSTDKVLAALGAGNSVVAMLDLPANAEQRTLEVPLLSLVARFPAGLAHVAADAGVCQAVFSCGLDFATGRRDLWIEVLPAGIAPQDALARYARHLDQRLHDAPEAWHMWREAPAIFVRNASDRNG